VAANANALAHSAFSRNRPLRRPLRTREGIRSGRTVV
jgi:hypothetical protein